jgi:hypothetical protein
MPDMNRRMFGKLAAALLGTRAAGKVSPRQAEMAARDLLQIASSGLGELLPLFEILPHALAGKPLRVRPYYDADPPMEPAPVTLNDHFSHIVNTQHVAIHLEMMADGRIGMDKLTAPVFDLLNEASNSWANDYAFDTQAVAQNIAQAVAQGFDWEKLLQLVLRQALPSVRHLMASDLRQPTENFVEELRNFSISFCTFLHDEDTPLLNDLTAAVDTWRTEVAERKLRLRKRDDLRAERKGEPGIDNPFFHVDFLAPPVQAAAGESYFRIALLAPALSIAAYDIARIARGLKPGGADFTVHPCGGTNGLTLSTADPALICFLTECAAGVRSFSKRPTLHVRKPARTPLASPRG